ETPEKELEQLLLVGRQRGIDRLLHGNDSTTKLGTVNRGGRTVTAVGQQLVRDVQRRHDGDALVAGDLARVADFLDPLGEVVGRGDERLLLALGARDAELAPEEGERQRALLAFLDDAHDSVSGICLRSASMRDFAAPSFSASLAFSSVRCASCWRSSRFSSRRASSRPTSCASFSSRLSSSGFIRPPYWKIADPSISKAAF